METPTSGTMTVVYALEDPPEAWSKAVFAAGPTPRSQDVTSWRRQLLELLEVAGYDGVVFIPEDRSGIYHGDYDAQVAWEDACLNLADVILFWIPRDMSTLPALTTNVEWGTWATSGKAVLGSPPNAAKNTYLEHYATELGIPTADTLNGTVTAALDMLGAGAARAGGERHIPLHVWRTPSFQAWYRAQTSAGNTLQSAKILWTFRAGPAGAVFYWACHADIWVAAEQRAKTNEIVLSRTDISTVVLYRPGSTVDETEVALVREFRTPAATADGYILECPGGSSWDATTTLETAVTEVAEEAGLRIDPSRLKHVGTRQLAGTMSAHRAHTYAAELTHTELAILRAAAQAGVVHGAADESERTYIVVTTVGELKKAGTTDWSTLGMILAALT